MPENQPETLRDLYETWQKSNRGVDRLIHELRMRGASSETIEHAVRNNYGRSHHWPEALVRPIAKALEASGRFDRVEVLGPQGVAARIALFAYRGEGDERPAATAYFVPDLRLEEGGSCLRTVDVEGDNGEYAPGTLGHLNGLHHPTNPVPMDARLGDSEYWCGLMYWRD